MSGIDDATELRHYDRVHDPVRVHALSDGVCAIIITLLVIEIHSPDLSRGETLRHALSELKPSLVAFAISFVVVAIAWVGHRDLFALIERTDRGLVWLNILYLFPLCLVPFGASVLANYWEDSTALVLYGLLLVAIALTRLSIWLYATNRPHLLVGPLDAQSHRVGITVAVVPGVAYGAGILLAEVSPPASLLIYAGVPLVYFAIITVARTTGAFGSAERNFT
jgi:uncharacterized membrane protein